MDMTLLEVIDELKKILHFDDEMLRGELELYVSELSDKADAIEKDLERQFGLDFNTGNN